MIKHSLINKPKTFNKIIGNQVEVDLFVSTDTRKVENENAFICLYGENFDAHSMLEKIIEHKSIKVIFVEKKRTINEILEDLAGKYSVSFVCVDDIFLYIRELANICVTDWRTPGKKLLGLTGSAGKTSSKEALYHILNETFPGKVLATKGNLNNYIGVPLTVFRLNPDCDIAVIEMGTSEPGEIKMLTEIVLPDAGMITNVGAAHLEKLIDLEGVFKEKSALYQVINDCNDGNGIVILPSDDVYLNRLRDFPSVFTFGKEGHYKMSFEKEYLKIQKGNTSWEFTNPIVEHHLLRNLAQAFILARTVFSDKTNELFKAALSYLPNQKNRGEIIEKEKTKIYLDAYNANPLSMKEAVDSFERLIEKNGASKENSLLILGDMLELGEETIRFHEELGEYLLQKKFINVFFVGEMGVALERRLESVKKFNSRESLKTYLVEQKVEKEFVMIKASRSLALEKLVDYFN